MQLAAGVQLVEPEGRTLFLKRSDSGCWAFPGGGVERGESTDEAAVRETREETGYLPEDVCNVGVTRRDGVMFQTFRHGVSGMFAPQLDHEHTDFMWAYMHEAPEPLHPGIVELFSRTHDFNPDELRDDSGKWTTGGASKRDPDQMTHSEIVAELEKADAACNAIPPTDKIDTPERNELRQHIVDQIYNKDISKRLRKREATIILGLPGVGKSTFAKPLVDAGAIEIDPDIAKAMLPEFKGGLGAMALHEESSAISRKVMALAIKNGDNFVWPRIDSPDKIVKDIKNLKSAGYKVNVKFIDASQNDSIKYVIGRYFSDGRYVPPHAVMAYGDKPAQSFELAAASGLVESAEKYVRTANGIQRAMT